jgi:hypothetical protein
MKLQPIDAARMAAFAIFFINGCVMLYISHVKVERMEAFLSRSKYIQDVNSRLRWFGLYGRLVRMGIVSGCLLYPRFWLNRGLLDTADVTEFPKGLRGLAVVPLVIAVSCFAAMSILDAIKG